MDWTNPNNVNVNEPFIYIIRIDAGGKEYRYIGKASKKSRLNAYNNNLKRIYLGLPKRNIPKDKPRREGNIKYRYVHLILAVAERQGWTIDHYPIENVPKIQLKTREQTLIREHDANLNSKRSWYVENLETLEAEFLNQTGET